MRRRLLLALAAVLSLTACTPRELRAWVAWYETDPEAATEFARNLVNEPAPDEPTPGDCESYWPLMQRHGLPRAFVRISYRESGCDHTRFTDDHDDLGGYLTGLNFRTAGLRAGWLSWCGATLGNIRYDVDRQLACTRAAYDRLGMRPWS